MQLCHREFKRSRLTAAEDVVNLSALVLLFVPALLFCGYFAVYGSDWLPLCYLPLIVGICSPIVSLLIIGAGISTLRRPTRIVANRWGLQFHFPFRRRRDLSWNQVRMGRLGRTLMRRSRGLVSIEDLLAITEEKTDADRAPMVLTTSPQPSGPVSSRNPIPLLVRPLLMLGALLAAGWMLLWGSPPYTDFSAQWSAVGDNAESALEAKVPHNRIIRAPQADRTIYLLSMVVPSQQAIFGDLDGDIDVPPDLTNIAIRTDLVRSGYIQRVSPTRVHFSVRVEPLAREDLLLTVVLVAPLSSNGTASIAHTNFSYILPPPTRSAQEIRGAIYSYAPLNSSFSTSLDEVFISSLSGGHALVPINPSRHIAASTDGALWKLCVLENERVRD